MINRVLIISEKMFSIISVRCGSWLCFVVLVIVSSCMMLIMVVLSSVLESIVEIGVGFLLWVLGNYVCIGVRLILVLYLISMRRKFIFSSIGGMCGVVVINVD